MSLTSQQRNELERFPIVLRTLAEAEIAAGNPVVEIASSHPATPIGAYIAFANKISTRPRASGDGVRFREPKGLDYLGEFTDDAAHFFVVETPVLLQSLYRSMDAIREDYAERERKADTDRFKEMW